MMRLSGVRTMIAERLRDNPESTDTFEVDVLLESRLRARETAVLPVPARGEGAWSVRYCAALVNNIAMVWGGTGVRCWGSNPVQVTRILECLDRRYPQVRDILADYYGQPVTIRRVLDRASPSTATAGNAEEASLPPSEDRGSAVGVNIGQTMIKVAAVRNGEEDESVRIIAPTWRDGRRSFAALLDRTTEMLERVVVGSHSIGISVGGIIRAGQVKSRSGVSASLSESDFHALNDLPAIIEQRTGLPTIMAQDVVAKAHDVRLRYPSRRVLVLDLGTSMGGAFISSTGTIPDRLNQVGRVVVDLSDDAVPRDDGQAVGVLSKYVSGSAYARLGGADWRIRSLSEPPTPGQALGDAHTRRIVTTLSEDLVEALVALNHHYDAEIVVLTGGLVQGDLGEVLLDAVRRQASASDTVVPLVEISSNPVFEGATGAARMACANRARMEPRG